jgi:hypothetical protein
MALIDGDDAIWGSCYTFEHFNRIKNHWQQAAPQENLTNPQPGMIVSDSDDNRLWHKLVAAGFAELLQAGGLLIWENDILCFEGEVLTCGI